MNLDATTLRGLMEMAQLELEAHREGNMCADLNKIVSWVEKLKEVDTTGVAPLVSMASSKNCFREDLPTHPLPHAKALQNAPARDSNYFQVPQKEINPRKTLATS